VYRIAFWNILLKDMRSYYLKPPNISWGMVFPLAWTGMFFVRSGSGLESVIELLPGVVALSILFGTTSVLAVTVTFEKKGRSFERLLLAPIPLELLMLAKTSGAILFGVINSFVPVAIASFLADLSGMSWIGERGVRGADVLQFRQVSDDIPVRPVLPCLDAAGIPAATLICVAPDVRGRCPSWRNWWHDAAVDDGGLHRAHGVLCAAVSCKPSEHPPQVDPVSSAGSCVRCHPPDRTRQVARVWRPEISSGIGLNDGVPVVPLLAGPVGASGVCRRGSSGLLWCSAAWQTGASACRVTSGHGAGLQERRSEGVAAAPS